MRNNALWDRRGAGGEEEVTRMKEGVEERRELRACATVHATSLKNSRVL